jgi:archaeal flagellar protein FlaI
VGHPGLSTIHAEDFNKLVDRMTTNPINLPGNLLENLDVVIFIKRVKRGRKFIRRISSLVEVIGFDQKIGFPVKNEVFVWNPIEDKFDTKNNSVILREISESTGLPQRDVIEEIEKRSKIINWMLERKINDYREVGAVVEAFYTNQERLLDKIEEGA